MQPLPMELKLVKSVEIRLIKALWGLAISTSLQQRESIAANIRN
jgi:hypothetical protein